MPKYVWCYECSKEGCSYASNEACAGRKVQCGSFVKAKTTEEKNCSTCAHEIHCATYGTLRGCYTWSMWEAKAAPLVARTTEKPCMVCGAMVFCRMDDHHVLCPSCARKCGETPRGVEQKGFSNASTPEPMPTGDGDVIVFSVIEDIVARSRVGEKKYGTILRANNGRNALMDLYQELLDAAMYVKQLLIEEESK